MSQEQDTEAEKKFRRRRRSLEEHNAGDYMDSRVRGGLRGMRARIAAHNLDKVLGPVEDDECSD